MRIWHVPFGELDDQRVLAQHNEIHALWNLIVRDGRKWDARWSDPARRYLLWDVHRRSVLEMRRRGWTGHQTPLNAKSPLGVHQLAEYCDHDEMLFLQRKDRWDLVCRWEGVYKGRIPMPPEYRLMLEKWRQDGCQHSMTRSEDFGKGWFLCLVCKQFATNDRGATWVRRDTVTEVRIAGRNPLYA